MATHRAMESRRSELLVRAPTRGDEPGRSMSPVEAEWLALVAARKELHDAVEGWVLVAAEAVPPHGDLTPGPQIAVVFWCAQGRLWAAPLPAGG